MLNTFPLDPVPRMFQGWSNLPVEDREEIRDLLNNRKHTWAKMTLAQKYGLDSDSDYVDSNSRVSDR